jgi:hypothetical protein
VVIQSRKKRNVEVPGAFSEDKGAETSRLGLRGGLGAMPAAVGTEELPWPCTHRILNLGNCSFPSALFALFPVLSPHLSCI